MCQILNIITLKSTFILYGLLLTIIFFSCGEKPKDDSVEDREAVAHDTVVNNEEISDEFSENTYVSDISSKKVKESVGLTTKNTMTNSTYKTETVANSDITSKKVKESVDPATKNTTDVMTNSTYKKEADTEEKTMEVQLAVKDFKQSHEVTPKNVKESVGDVGNKNKDFNENYTQKTKDLIREPEEKSKEVDDVIAKKTKQPIEGIWDTGTEKTKIEILQINGEWIGKIKSSENQEVTIGKVILDDLKKQNEKWKGKIFIVKKQKWTDVEIIPSGTKLDLVVSTGFSNKKIQWSKVND